MSWDANVEEDLAGYRVYWGRKSHNYQNWVDVGNILSTEIMVQKKQTVYVAVTAYDISGNESEFSAEVLGNSLP